MESERFWRVPSPAARKMWGKRFGARLRTLGRSGLGQGRSEEAAPRRSRGGGRVRPSSASSGELGPAGLGLTASLEVEEVATGFGRGNAVAEEVRRRGAGHNRRWRRRRSRGGGVLVRGASSGGLYR